MATIGDAIAMASQCDILRHDFDDDDDDDDDAGCVDARTCVGIIRSRAAHE